jgi:uncharacterized protein YcnI
MHRRHQGLLAAILGVLILVMAGPAGAHVEPTATEVPAGSYATVAFTVQHGCESSPTVKLEFQIPDELDDVVPVDKPGWTTAVDAGVVTFEGGPLPTDEEAEFSVGFTVPETQGVQLTFPFIQTCEVGSIDWIQTTSDAERPAPVVMVVAPDPNAPTAPAPSSTTSAPEASTTTTEPVATTTEAAPPADSTEQPNEDSGTNPWLAVVGVIGVTAAVVSGVIVLRNRST